MKLRTKSLAVAGALFLAACGGSALDLAGINSLGSGFVALFNAALTDEPVDAQSVNLVAVSYTTDPFNP